ncbi:hypothetical protein [Chrysiogenes arsenatis]|uniref:hypothetical protein n=1 Tax=Chrysiogenes arsenatis TaxID=309797 RepID=UPI00135F19FC|nr:hypothetical protein [Chrysiogenes arsenatis]
MIIFILSGCAAKIPATPPHDAHSECENVQGRGKIRWSEGSTFDMTFAANSAHDVLFHIHDLFGRRVISFAFVNSYALLLDHRESTFTWISKDDLCFDERFCFIDTQLSLFLTGKFIANNVQNPHCVQQDTTQYRCESENHWVRLTIRERACFPESITPLEIPGGYRERPLHRAQLR